MKKLFYNFNFVILVLGVITIAELFFTKGLGGSIILWILYGVYKLD